MSTEIENIEESSKKKIESSFDVAGLLLDFLSHWKWFVLCVIVCLCCAYYYVATIIPTYTVGASIYLNDDNSVSGSQALGAKQNMYNPATFAIDETEIKILKSKNNIIKIVDSLDLAYSYYYVGKVRDVPTYHDSAVLASLDSISLRNLSSPIEIYIDKEGSGYKVVTKSYFNNAEEKKVLSVKKLPARFSLSQGTITLTESPLTKHMYGTEKIVISNPNWVAGAISGQLSIGYANNSNSILSLSVNTTVVEQGRDILRALVEFYNRKIIEDKNRSAIQTEAFILDRLSMINSELKDVEDRLREYRSTHGIIDLESQTTTSLTQHNSTESELAAVDLEREILNEIENMVSRQDTYCQLPTITNNATVSQGIETYNQAVLNYERARESMGADHPHIAELQTTLNRQKAQILSNISAAKRDVSARRRSIVSLDNRSLNRLAEQPTLDKGLNEIFREQQVKVNIYTYLLQQREEIALQKTLATPTAQFIDNPSGGGLVQPQSSAYYSLALLIGLLIPGLIIFLKRLLFPTFNDKEDLERVTKVPVIGEICVNNSENDIVIGESVSSSIAELFRLLRNNINFVKGANGDKKVILVTSSVAGEGKTFVASNLAMTYALSGKKTVIVGLDIRRPVLAHKFGFSNNVGVTTYLSGQVNDIDSFLHQTEINPNLYVIPAGPVPPNPNELLLSERTTEFFKQLRERFDCVILDSAPIGLVSDTYLVVAHSDVQLYVARAGYSTKNGLKVLHEAINSGRMPNVYIVLNDVHIDGSAYVYRRYGQYGYYSTSSYTYAYGEKSGKHHHHHKKRSLFKRLFKRKIR
jgi:capsular exopolysaccharide synthesis family protein